MHIRPATFADAPAISSLNATVQGLHAAAHPHIFKTPEEGAFPPEEVAVLLAQPDNVVLLALVDDAPAGYILFSTVHRPEAHWRHAIDMVYIHHISVDAAFQGQGVGHALINAARAYARTHGITHVELDVWAFNTHARAFFEREGFEAYNVRMWMELEDRE